MWFCSVKEFLLLVCLTPSVQFCLHERKKNWLETFRETESLPTSFHQHVGVTASWTEYQHMQSEPSSAGFTAFYCMMFFFCGSNWAASCSATNLRDAARSVKAQVSRVMKNNHAHMHTEFSLSRKKAHIKDSSFSFFTHLTVKRQKTRFLCVFLSVFVALSENLKNRICSFTSLHRDKMWTNTDKKTNLHGNIFLPVYIPQSIVGTGDLTPKGWRSFFKQKF